MKKQFAALEEAGFIQPAKGLVSGGLGDGAAQENAGGAGKKNGKLNCPLFHASMIMHLTHILYLLQQELANVTEIPKQRNPSPRREKC